MELTYPEVGATLDGALPAGYRRVCGRSRIGQGARVYRAAVRALRTFDMHRAAGLRVRPARPRAVAGAMLVWGAGVGPARLWAPCRMVWVRDEPTRYGYGYGTLSGHPEAGEEAFTVSLDIDDTVWFEVRAFSRPDRWYSRLAGPLTGLAQDMTTQRYRDAIARLATTNAPA